jgi:PAS domain S-box-containing protein
MKPDSRVTLGHTEHELLQIFVEGINDYAIYMLSPDGHVMSWNAGAQRFKGYQHDEIIGEHFSRFYTEEDQAAGVPERVLQTALAEGKFETEGWRVRNDGKRFWASVVIDPIRDRDGKLLGFAKITRDIDERRRAEAALHASEEQFRILVQGVTDYAIYMLSPAGEITNWNSGAEKIKGYNVEEVVGSHFSRFYTEEDRQRGLPERALEIARREGRFEGEGRRVRRDGTPFWAHVVIDPIYDQTGTLIGFAKVTRDITERKESEKALERAKESLFQAQKLDALGKLTGGVAHDFNNLLSVIVSGLEILSKEIKSPAGTRTLASMLRASTRGATLTQQLLSFARQQPLKQEKYNLNALVTGFESLLRRARHESVSLHLDLHPGLRPVRIDAVQFEAALLNLVTNANDAMPNGGTLIVRTENARLEAGEVGVLPAGDFVKVTVMDSGVGMSQAVAARAMEPFFTTKEIGKGTGMGLSQVLGLVQQSGGDMVVQSEPGKGTSIALYLPALAAQEGEDLASPDINAGAEKVLVVDDQPDVLESAIELFKVMGYDVLAANNGAEALEILKRVPDIEVLFSDIVMPGMDGVTLGREARKLVPAINVILVSGYPASHLSKEGEDMSEFRFLKKPFRMAEVARMLRQAVTARRTDVRQP